MDNLKVPINVQSLPAISTPPTDDEIMEVLKHSEDSTDLTSRDKFIRFGRLMWQLGRDSNIPQGTD